jgi:serine/threonine-protein kinase RsbW
VIGVTMDAMTGSAVEVPPTTGDVVDLEVPAAPAYISVVRTATAGLAARVDITMDRIEDLRIAVDEACTLLIRPQDHLHPDGALRCRFTLQPGSLTVEVNGPRTDLPPSGAVAWSVLSALVDIISWGQDEPAPDRDGRTWLRLTVRRGSGAPT